MEQCLLPLLLFVIRSRTIIVNMNNVPPETEGVGLGFGLCTSLFVAINDVSSAKRLRLQKYVISNSEGDLHKDSLLNGVHYAFCLLLLTFSS